MATSIRNRYGAGEENTEQLQQETEKWIDRLYYSAEILRFFSKFLKAPIFKIEHQVFEKLEKFKIQLEETRLELHELNTLVYNHRSDLEGMRECDDVSCDVFYQEQHEELQKKVVAFLKYFRQFQLDILNYTENLLPPAPSQNQQN